MTTSAREVLLVGSMPLRPASAVFETVARHLDGLVKRIPDGEQSGWVRAVWRTLEAHPALQVGERIPLNTHSQTLVNIYQLRPGYTAADLQLGPYGYAENALGSYAAFKQLKQRGALPGNVRLQVTLPGPGTGASAIQIPGSELLPIARQALWTEIEQITNSIPASELTLQLDIGMEAEHEEYLRNPAAFDQPIHHIIDWTHAQMADSVAWLGNRVPPDVELGFHICSIWHHDPAGGQDNAVLVDTANAIASRIDRPIAYFHIPVVPDHSTPAHYAPFKQLQLRPETQLFLGLINLADGVDGARRRIALAQAAVAVADFGVGFWCGLGRGDGNPSAATQDILRRPTPDTIGEVLDLHRAVAELSAVPQGATP